ncbi:MAG: Lrp/AsnC ligand binding domain-containing protein [Mobilicoccus sp.]|nr:Lrp/AsnC ligand binding domain-containing protein [Mobilicoccus sp.]
MITAIVLINAEVHRIPEAAQAIVEIEGVSEVYSVTGGCDLIAVVKVARHEDFADVIADRINKTSGVLSTDTHIAFKTYSTEDLDAAFAIGLD